MSLEHSRKTKLYWVEKKKTWKASQVNKTMAIITVTQGESDNKMTKDGTLGNTNIQNRATKMQQIQEIQKSALSAQNTTGVNDDLSKRPGSHNNGT